MIKVNIASTLLYLKIFFDKTTEGLDRKWERERENDMQPRGSCGTEPETQPLYMGTHSTI